MGVMKGSTAKADAPILGADFWKKGTRLEGRVTRLFDTVNGPCSEILLSKPIEINKKMHNTISVGNMKGFNMAVANCGTDSLVPNDCVVIDCVGETDTGKGSPRIDFVVEINRAENGKGPAKK